VGVTGRGRAAADAGRQQCSLLSWSMHSLITIQTVSYHVVRVHECNCQHTTHHALVSRAARSRETGGAGWLEKREEEFMCRHRGWADQPACMIADTHALTTSGTCMSQYQILACRLSAQGCPPLPWLGCVASTFGAGLKCLCNMQEAVPSLSQGF
jgi:hypothetical protein